MPLNIIAYVQERLRRAIQKEDRQGRRRIWYRVSRQTLLATGSFPVAEHRVGLHHGFRRQEKSYERHGGKDSHNYEFDPVAEKLPRAAHSGEDSS